MRRLLPAVGLFLLAPVVAEFLLGDFPITYAAALLLLAPLYGGGALFIREIARRTGRGRPTMAVLALAYGVFEEGIATQSLFNPEYAHAHLLDKGYVPALGIALPWTLFVLGLHAVWSIGVPIVVVEELAGERKTEPWLGRAGLAVTAVLLVVGAAAITLTTYAQYHFVAPASRLAGVVAITAALAVLAFRLPREGRTGSDRPAPGPVPVLCATLAAGLVFMLAVMLPAVPAVAVQVALYAGAAWALVTWSRRPGWGSGQGVALAAGGLLTYAWHGFVQSPVVETSRVLDRVSDVVLGLGAVALCVWLRRAAGTRHG